MCLSGLVIYSVTFANIGNAIKPTKGKARKSTYRMSNSMGKFLTFYTLVSTMELLDFPPF